MQDGYSLPTSSRRASGSSRFCTLQLARSRRQNVGSTKSRRNQEEPHALQIPCNGRQAGEQLNQLVLGLTFVAQLQLYEGQGREALHGVGGPLVGAARRRRGARRRGILARAARERDVAGETPDLHEVLADVRWQLPVVASAVVGPWQVSTDVPLGLPDKRPEKIQPLHKLSARGPGVGPGRQATGVLRRYRGEAHGLSWSIAGPLHGAGSGAAGHARPKAVPAIASWTEGI